MHVTKKRRSSHRNILIVVIVLALSSFPYSNASLPSEGLGATTTTKSISANMETLSQATTLISQGGSVDSTVEKITVNPKLDEIDEKYSKCGGVDIREVSILQLQNLFSSGQLTVTELTKCYVERLNQMNPVLRAVIEVNPDALSDAITLDQELKLGKLRGPMHGIPVLLKEGIGTADSMETTAGSPALVGIRPKKDAYVVTALRKAGAIILGKANLSEFYWFRGSNIPNGWSGRGGQTRNAYNLNVTPEGSSSGSAVAVSANLCAVSVGTETDGSMIGPANYAGIFAMKPTWGLVSVKGVIPVSHTQDHVGPMARSAADLSILLDAMVPEEDRPPHHPQSYTQFVLNDSSSGRPFRIGVLRYPFWDTNVINSTNLREQLPHFENLLRAMNNSSSFEVADPVEIMEKDTFKRLSLANELIILLHDFKHDFNEYLKNDVIYPTTNSNSPAEIPAFSKTISSLKDVIQYNNQHPTPQGYNQEYLIKSEATDGLLNETYVKARETNRAAARQLLDSVLENYNLDAIVTPSDSQPQGISDNSLEDFPTFGFSIAAQSGYPSINIPAGVASNGVPFGILFIGNAHSEPTLLTIAHKVEQISTQKRVQPKFQI